MITLEFPVSHRSSSAVLSPGKTRVVYTCHRGEAIIAIIDQRWPIDYQLPASNVGSFANLAPDAYTSRHVITVVDQRHGIIHHINNNHDVHFCDLKFSPDGRFLASTYDHGIIKVWNNDVVGNYEQLQQWNIGEDGNESWLPRIDVSTCSKYIVIAYARNGVVLKRIENGKTLKSLTPRQSGMESITKIKLFADCRAVCVCCQNGNSSVIKL